MSRYVDPELTRLIDLILNHSSGYLDIFNCPDQNMFCIVEYHGTDFEKIAEFPVKFIDFADALIYYTCGY